MRKIKLGDDHPEPTRESTIEIYLCQEVKKLGGLALKWSSMNVRGVPDRIVLMPNCPAVFVELKAPGKKPTALQAQMIQKLKDLGNTVQVIDSKEGVRQFLFELLT